MIQGVIFDLGSTLIHFEGDWGVVLDEGLKALTERLGQDGLVLTGTDLGMVFRREMEASQRERIHDNRERTSSAVLRQTLASLGWTEVSEQAVARALEGLFAASEAHWQPMPGVHEMLHELRGHGYRLGLISNASDEANVKRLLARAGLMGVFEPELVSAAVGIRKPDPRLFERVVTAWDVPARDVAMVGDTLAEDILGAQQAGLRSIWFTADADTPANRAQSGKVRPDASTDDLRRLPAILLSLDGARPGG